MSSSAHTSVWHPSRRHSNEVFWSPLFCIRAETAAQRRARTDSNASADQDNSFVPNEHGTGTTIVIVRGMSAQSSESGGSGRLTAPENACRGSSELHQSHVPPYFAYHSVLSLPKTKATSDWHKDSDIASCSHCKWLNETLKAWTDPGSLIENVPFMRDKHDGGIDLRAFTEKLEKHLYPEIRGHLEDIDPSLKHVFVRTEEPIRIPIPDIWDNLTRINQDKMPKDAQEHFCDTVLAVCSLETAIASQVSGSWRIMPEALKH